MFADQTLTPKEAVRLCALGMVVERQLHYGELAGGVRHFIGRVMGPSLDLMGISIELLRYEGLVEPVDGKGMEDNALIAVTPAGRAEFEKLITARLRPSSELAKLLTALKFRFLHLLEKEEQQNQIDLLIDALETEIARLTDLCEHEEAARGGDAYLVLWLSEEIAQSRARLDWLKKLSAM
jgi:hypothetical protein